MEGHWLFKEGCFDLWARKGDRHVHEVYAWTSLCEGPVKTSVFDWVFEGDAVALVSRWVCVMYPDDRVHFSPDPIHGWTAS